MRRRRTSREVLLSRKAHSQGTSWAVPFSREIPQLWPQGCTWEQACQWWASVWADKEKAALVRSAPMPRTSPAVMGGVRFVFIRHPHKERKQSLEGGTGGPSPLCPPLPAVYGPSCSAAINSVTETKAALCLGVCASINVEATQNV